MNRYVDFWQVTSEALRSAADRLQTPLSAAEIDGLMNAYLSPDVFEDAKTALDSLKSVPLAILSNGTPRMLDAALRAHGLESYFAHVLSVDEVRTYKPSPEVYALGTKTLGLAADTILFVSSNAWDVAGAKSFGYRVCWCNRSGEPMDGMGFEPDFIVARLGQIPNMLAGAD